MLFDLQSGVAALSQGNYDVCVCGGGPAGITVARELAAGGKRVAVLEAGGLEYAEQSQSFYAGTESGLPTFNTALKSNRLRFFGGTSNHWSGLCGVFEEADFWPKRYHDLPGWPIARSDVMAHLQEASGILDLVSPDFAPSPYGNAKRDTFKRHKLANSPPTRFGAKFRKEFVESRNIHLFLNANLIDLHMALVPGESPRIDHVVVSNYRRETAKLPARQYVLAMGSIENARLLLNADKQVRNGIGNHSDFVGRCFMEHFNVQIGRFVTRKGKDPLRTSALLSPTDRTMRQANIGNGLLSLNPDAIPQEGGRLGPVRGALREAACKFDTVRDFARKFKDFDCAGEGSITSLLEQAPDPNSRMTLTKDLDSFQLRRVNLHWTLNDADRRTIRTLGYELAKELLELDVARIQLSPFIVDPRKEIEVWPHAHQMGTTRMSAEPRHGVVDGNCKVHGVGNLYVAGSSVFPTGGGVNPTLTIVMLALRLGKLLRTSP